MEEIPNCRLSQKGKLYFFRAYHKEREKAGKAQQHASRNDHHSSGKLPLSLNSKTSGGGYDSKQ